MSVPRKLQAVFNPFGSTSRTPAHRLDTKCRRPGQSKVGTWVKTASALTGEIQNDSTRRRNQQNREDHTSIQVRAVHMAKAIASGIVSRPGPIETSEAQAQRKAQEPGPKGDSHGVHVHKPQRQLKPHKPQREPNPTGQANLKKRSHHPAKNETSKTEIVSNRP